MSHGLERAAPLRVVREPREAAQDAGAVLRNLPGAMVGTNEVLRVRQRVCASISGLCRCSRVGGNTGKNVKNALMVDPVSAEVRVIEVDSPAPEVVVWHPLVRGLQTVPLLGRHYILREVMVYAAPGEDLEAPKIKGAIETLGLTVAGGGG